MHCGFEGEEEGRDVGCGERGERVREGGGPEVGVEDWISINI